MTSKKPSHSRRSSLSIRYPDGKRTINFKAGSKLGLALGDKCDVKAVRSESAAYWVGVEVGYVITAVDTTEVEPTTVKGALKGAIASNKAFSITFKVPDEVVAAAENQQLGRTASAAKAIVASQEKPKPRSAPSMGLYEMMDKEAEDAAATGMDTGGPSMAERISKKFEELDLDHNGAIDLNEFTTALYDLGLQGMTKDEIAEFMKSVSDNGTLSLRDFSTVCAAAIQANPHAKNYPPPLDMNFILLQALKSYAARKKMHDQFGKAFEGIRKDMKLDDLLARQIAEKFDQLDSDHDGSIDVNEFMGALQVMGLTMKKSDALRTMSSITGGGDKIMLADFKKVIAAAANKNTEAGVDELLRIALGNFARKAAFQRQLAASNFELAKIALDRVAVKFKQIDSKKDGKLDADELTPYLKKLGFAWTKRQIKGFIGAIDKDGDGFISGTEFKTALFASLSRNPAQSVDSALKNAINNLGKGAAARTELLKGGVSKLKKTKPRDKAPREDDVMDKIAAAFIAADVDHSGSLNPQEFADLLLSLDLGYRREYVERIFRKIDVNNDRQLDFVELKVVMINAATKNPDLPVGEIMQIVLASMLNKKPLGQELTEGDFKLKPVVVAPAEPAAEVKADA